MRSLPLLFLLGASLVGCDAADTIDAADAPFNAKNPFEPGTPQPGDRACAIDTSYGGMANRHIDIEHDADGHIIHILDRNLQIETPTEILQTWVNGRLATKAYGTAGLSPSLVTTYVRNPHGAVVREDEDGDFLLTDGPPDGKVDHAWFTEYDARGLPTSIIEDMNADGHADDAETTLATTLVFDERELLVLEEFASPDGSSATSFTYDDRGLLVDGATDNDGDGAADTTEHRTYDAAGRLLTLVSGTSTEVYEYAGDSPDPVRMTSGMYEQRWTYDCAAK